MRAILAASVALGALALAQSAWAVTKVGDGSKPIDTSTINSGAPDDIDLTGTLTLKSGTAITQTSNNSITNDGTINMASTANGSTGILGQGGFSGSITNNGSITLSDGSSRTDTINGDGIADGAWAKGENLCAICVAGSGTFTGNVTNASGAQIIVTGNDSYGISIGGLPTGTTTLVTGETDPISDPTPNIGDNGTIASTTGGPTQTLTSFVGNLLNAGTINITGDNDFGIVTTAPITGTVTINGSINVVGANSVGVALLNNVSGRVVFGGSITSTGFSSTTAPVDSTALNKVLSTKSDVQNGGPAVVIGGSMAQGVLFDAAPVASTTNTDVDGDGVPDVNQTTSSISVIGSAPAIQIGSSSKNIELGIVGTTVSSFSSDYDFGLIIKGSVIASGIYSGFSATGVEVGISSPTAPNMGVLIDGGVRVSGAITASSVDEAATGIQFDALSEADLLRVDGSITATSTAQITLDTHDAIAVLIKDGATVKQITNSGSLTADSASLEGNAVVIRDQSGTLGDIENSGLILATVSDPNAPPSDEVIGQAIAVDAEANTTGVTFHQFQAPTPTGSTTAPAAPSTTGAILLGSGNDNVDIEAGSVNGLIFFGSGTDQLTINNGATVTGGIFQTSGGLSVNLADGTLTDNNGATLNITNLNVGAKSTLVLTIDPAANSGAGSGGFVVSGTANLDTGASLGVRFTSLITGPSEFDLIKVTDPANLTAGTINLSSIAANTPFLFVSTAGVNTTDGTVFVDVRRRTAAEANLIPAEAAAFNAFYNVLGNDQQLEAAFLAQTTRGGFINLYDQMLPEHSGAPLLSLASGVDAVSRALADRRPVAPTGEITGWAQEINFVANKDEGDAFGFRTHGFGMASGLEIGSDVGSFGTSFAFTSSDMKDQGSQGDANLSANMVELGVYWRETGPHLRTWARGAVGYSWFNSIRQFLTPGATIVRAADSDWDGYSASAAAGMSYEQDFGRWFVRPEVTTEYFYLHENSHSEGGGGEPDCSTTITSNCGGDGFDLAIGQRSGHYFTASAMMNIGGKFGVDQWLQPELHFGWTQYISVDPGVTTAHFINDPADPFNLFADTLNGGGPVVGFRLLAQGAAGFIALEGDADLMKTYKRYQLMIRAGYRF
ncbi:MAG TPA: hypothetical protein VGL66_05020 [Caulobacteraceae bacterium]|jgi:hypothetical protein